MTTSDEATTTSIDEDGGGEGGDRGAQNRGQARLYGRIAKGSAARKSSQSPFSLSADARGRNGGQTAILRPQAFGLRALNGVSPYRRNSFLRTGQACLA